MAEQMSHSDSQLIDNLAEQCALMSRWPVLATGLNQVQFYTYDDYDNAHIVAVDAEWVAFFGTANISQEQAKAVARRLLLAVSNE